RGLGFDNPIAIIPNGVALPHHPIERPDVMAGPRTALFLSRIHPKKGLLDLVEAWDLVRPAGWRVEIAGHDDDNHQAAVETLIERKGLREVFFFSGEVSDVDKWLVYGRAELFILPTRSENFGIVIAEALGSGLPVITTKGAPWASLNEH